MSHLRGIQYHTVSQASLLMRTTDQHGKECALPDAPSAPGSISLFGDFITYGVFSESEPGKSLAGSSLLDWLADDRRGARPHLRNDAAGDNWWERSVSTNPQRWAGMQRVPTSASVQEDDLQAVSKSRVSLRGEESPSLLLAVSSAVFRRSKALQPITLPLSTSFKVKILQ